jgi:hypothetical protein
MPSEFTNAEWLMAGQAQNLPAGGREPVPSGPATMIAKLITAMLFTSAVLQPANLGENNGSVELHIEAAYLLNFGRYVSWPQPAGDVIIGVLGHHPIVEILERTIAGKTINGRSCRVKVYPTPEHIDHCEILFLPRSEARQTQAAIAALAGKPILTVSDLEHFSSDGGMIEFLLIDDTVKFDINLGTVERSGLKIGSELLRVARGIKGRNR